jgi:DNA polymerase III subunit gamma/tau
MAWYNTYRPTTFEDVIGQDLAKKVLQNTLTQGKVKHAYLLSGPKGVGKTTLARIFANQLNQTDKDSQAELDIIELDAASNTGIDNIRQLIESAQVPPIAGSHKIYIIDEVHMLSKPAMNALLKILEEPPQYLVFLLATTNPEKLIDTVMSRLTKLQLSSHSQEQLIKRLEYIAKEEKVTIDAESLKLIAKRSKGSQRDAINLLETVASYGLDSYDEQTTAQLLGMVSTELLEKTALALANQDIENNMVESINNSGIDGTELLAQLLDYLLDKAFSGYTHHDELIGAVAHLMSLKLSLTTPLSALTLTLVELRKTGSAPVKKKLTDTAKTKESKPTQNLNEATPQYTVQTSAPAIETVEEVNLIASKEEIESVQEVKSDSSAEGTASTQGKNQNQEAQLEEAHIDNMEKAIEEQSTPQGSVSTIPHTPDELSGFLFTIMNQSDAPMSFKMILPSCTVVNIVHENGPKIVIGTSHNIFVSQLKSANNNQYLSKSFSEHLQTQVAIEITQTESTASVSLPTHDIPEFIGPDDSELESESTQDTPMPAAPIATNNAKSGTIFYKIYKQLPPNIEAGKIQVLTELQPAPESTWGKTAEKQTSGESHDWDNHVDDMFEME